MSNTPDSFAQIVNDMGFIELKRVDGIAERIQIKQVPISRLALARAGLADPCKFICAVLGKSPEWVDLLDPGQAIDLYTKLMEANEDFLSKAGKAIAPVETAHLKLLLEKL